MGANFINLFESVMNNLNFEVEKSSDFNIPNNQYLESEKYRYIFNYDCGILNFVICKK